MALVSCSSVPPSPGIHRNWNNVTKKKVLLEDNQRNWNKIIKKRVLGGNYERALKSYKHMQGIGLSADNFTYPLLLKAAGNLGLSGIGLALHGQAIKTQFCDHAFVETALLNMYSSCRCIDGACKVFEQMGEKDLVAWNSMLNAYVSCGLMDNAVQLFDKMPSKDPLSYNIMVTGHASRGTLACARQLFDGSPHRDIVSWNSMIFAYGNFGDMEEARKLFDEMPEQNTISWNTMLTAYLRNGLYDDAILLFEEMRVKKVGPDHVTITTISSACAHLASLNKGKEVHIYAQEHGLALNRHVTSSLIDMYSKCGSILSAVEVFYKSPIKDIYCWNAIISALALHGYALAALKLFDKMIGYNQMPDDITFIGLLGACSHAGLVQEGCDLFKSMERDYTITPKLEHYGCMVDLFGRAGLLDSAFELIESMTFEPGRTMLSALLGACVNYRDVERGERVLKLMCDMDDPLTDGEYMMVVNLYASCNEWDKANRWREKMNDAGIEKAAGCSAVEVDGSAYKFLAGNKRAGQECLRR